MIHDLARICSPAVFGAPVWICACGHRSWSDNDHQQHIEETNDGH